MTSYPLTLFAATRGMSRLRVRAGVIQALERMLDDQLRATRTALLLQPDVDVDAVDELIDQSRVENLQRVENWVDAILEIAPLKERG